MAETKKATFALNFEGNAPEVTEDLAVSLEDLRKKIDKSQEAVRTLGGAMKGLRGKSEEVVSAKEQLKAKLEAERAKISEVSLALLKQGASYDQLAARTRRLAAEKKKLDEKKTADALEEQKRRASAMGNAVKAAGGPVGSLREKLEAMREVLGKTGTGMGLVTLATVGLVAAIAAVTAAAVGGLVAFGRWVLTSANAARTAGLFREAALGSALQAHNLGTQVDALAEKVPTAKDKLNELAVSLSKTRLSGPAIVDTLNAVAQASAAMGDEVGGAFKDIVTRGQLSGRLQLSPQELFGKGLEFDDVAKALANGMHTSVDAARRALFEGRVKLEDGAKALRTAVEKRFGDVNLRRMLDLNVLAEKFHETLANLTKGVNIEPLGKALASLGELFSERTFTGAAIKKLVELVGNGLVGALTRTLPIAKAFLQGMAIAGLELTLTFLDLKDRFSETFGNTEFISGAKLLEQALVAGKIAVYGFAAGVAITAAGLAAVAAVIKGTVDQFSTFIDSVKSAWRALVDGDWSALGKAIVDGFVKGLSESPIGKVVSLFGDKIKKAFSSSLKIQSPSKVFEEYGKQTAAGFEKGVEGGAGDASLAVSAMGKPPAAGGRAGGGAPIILHVHIDASGHKDAPAVSQALSQPSFLASLTEAVENAIAARGLRPEGA